jgi:hypothetical protein
MGCVHEPVTAPGSSTRAPAIVAVAVALLLATPAAAHAYIGPGAGFAFVSSFFVTVTTGLLALFSLVMWPIRAMVRRLRRHSRVRPRIGRLVILVFQGADSNAIDWSAFSTGVATGSTIAPKPFWIELSERGVWSTILNVPVPLARRRFHGVQLIPRDTADRSGTATPATQPASYGWYLSRRIGAFGTMSRGEEQRAIFRAALDRFQSGVLVSVLDADAENAALVSETRDRLHDTDVLIVNPAAIEVAPAVFELFGVDSPLRAAS